MARRMTGPDAGTRLGIVNRALWRCERCGEPTSTASIHHRTPRGMGGTKLVSVNEPANLVLLCGSGTTGCHGWIEHNRAEAREHGWLVPRGSDPTEIPIVDSKGRPWLLDNDYQKVAPTTPVM